MRNKLLSALPLACSFAFSGCVATHPESASAKPPAQIAAPAAPAKPIAAKPVEAKPVQGPQSDLDYLRGKVQALASTGLITDVNAESSTARVDPKSWDALDVQEKQTVTTLLAMYIGHLKGRTDGTGISVLSSRNDSVFAEVSMWTGRVTINR